MEIQDLVGYSEVEHDLVYVNGELRGYTAKPFVDPIRVISRRSFMKRFTLEERAALRDSTDIVVKDFLYELELAQDVTLSLPENREGLLYIVSIGLLEAHRVDEILVPGTPEEV